MVDHGSFSTKDAIRVVFLCFSWYTLSASGNIIVKTLLNDFPYPMTIVMVQLLSIWVYLQPVLKCWHIPPIDPMKVPWRYYFTMIFPLAFAKFITAVSAHISLWKVTVSYAHTVKASMPFFTILLSKLIFNESQTIPVYLSIIPIILGVCVATATELSFDVSGLVSALIATIGFSSLNIFTKKALHITGLHHLRMLHIISKMTFLLFLPVWVYADLTRILQDEAVMAEDKVVWSISLLLIDAFTNFAVNVVAFTLLAIITPLSYAVANATKRIVIISSSLVLLRNPVTMSNIGGMLLAVAGVLAYNKAKYDQTMKQRRDTNLPLVKSEGNLLTHNLHLSPLHRTNTDLDIHNHFTVYMEGGDTLYNHYRSVPEEAELTHDHFYNQYRNKA